tara:strand:- start:1735 stop:3642 length:1908 start_codon:yes stop_codon:yes gene_type:complete
MSRWFYYFKLAWYDLFRLRSATQHHIIIVAGICLPILMLLGLKRGHVETLRQDLITSPSGRQITFWSAQTGELMDREAIERLTKTLPAVDVIIPESQRVVSLSAIVNDKLHQVETATLYATRTNDPLLKQADIVSPQPGAREIIIGDGVAEQLHVRRGETVTITVSRGSGVYTESADVECLISGIIPTQERSASIGYVDIDLLDDFNAYGHGHRVTELGWPSGKISVPDSYVSYLIFCEVDEDLTESDREYLRDRGFQLKPCAENPPAPLGDLLASKNAEKLLIYEAFTDQSYQRPDSRLRISPSELSEATEADDVVLPWNLPQTINIKKVPWQITGLSMPRRTWLREYFTVPDLPFDYDAEAFTARAPFLAQELTSLNWPLAGDDVVQLKIDRDLLDKMVPVKIGSQKNENHILAVPANLLAWVQAYHDKVAEYDSDLNLFVPRKKPAIYDRARLYASTIDDVPDAVNALAERGFAVMSETGRITEIQQQDQSLQLLVWVVGLGVFLFGVLTVFSVLMDSTDRKRSAIGIMRVMGMSRAGVFTTILLRATVIGAAAAVLSLLCGWGLGLFLGWSSPPEYQWLSWKPVVSIHMNQFDVALVFAGAMICCGLGALPPAWKASRLDPFDAIVEGRFR